MKTREEVDTQPTSIRLPADLKARLVELAANDDRSFNNYVAKVLREHVVSVEKKGRR